MLAFSVYDMRNKEWFGYFNKERQAYVLNRSPVRNIKKFIQNLKIVAKLFKASLAERAR